MLYVIMLSVMVPIPLLAVTHPTLFTQKGLLILRNYFFHIYYTIFFIKIKDTFVNVKRKTYQVFI